MDTLLGLLAVFALVASNGFFVAAEFSLVGARRTRIAQLASEGNVAAKVAQKAMEHLDAYIAATQLGITLSSLALGWIGEPAIAHIFEPLFHLLLPEELVETVSHTISIVLAFSIVTLLHIVMGELVPKSIALQRPEATSLVVARPVTWFLIIFRPVIQLMNGVGNSIVRALGFHAVGEHTSVHSAEELEMLVHSSRQAGLLQESEEVLLRRAFDFSDTRVEEIMQPRVEVEGIPLGEPLSAVLDIIASSHHSRYPVYEDTIDNIVGLLLTKDLLDLIIRQPDLLADRKQRYDLRGLLRKPLFVPESVSVDQLLEQMQETKLHMAVVIDEYGGTAGMATMEDIIELLVGDVRDEYDEEERLSIQAKGDDTVVDGLLSLNEVIERFGEPDIEAESTTLGGYVAEVLNRIPVTGDKAVFGDYDLHVEEMEGMRVARVRFVHRETPPDQQDKGDET
ncbi:MAG: HlyC/CorC family transporter [Anaerolineae bacterium]|nr:HlyC/CorC family transporter [Anaerolineae bacterium]